MLQIDFERLRALGLTPALAQLACAVPLPPSVPSASARLMRLTEVHRETVRVHCGHADRSARVAPRLLRALADEGTALAVGDWVLVTTDDDGPRDGLIDALRETSNPARSPDPSIVIDRVPPTSHILRRDADGRRHPVVSNVDTALLVMGLDDDFNPRRLERYLVLVQASGVRPVVVLTKADVLAPEPGALEARVASLLCRLPADIAALAVDGTDPATADRLLPWLGAGQTLVLLGSSGAGKSTLTNTLLGAAVQDTGAVREHDSRGKHTTTSRSLHRLHGGACVIDTPGLRTLRPDADEATLAASFADVEQLAHRCRFRDCRHHDEPGCAVREGVHDDRLRNYQKLLREAKRDSHEEAPGRPKGPHPPRGADDVFRRPGGAITPLEKQQQAAVWKSRTRSTRAWMKVKRGEG